MDQLEKYFVQNLKAWHCVIWIITLINLKDLNKNRFLYFSSCKIVAHNNFFTLFRETPKRKVSNRRDPKIYFQTKKFSNMIGWKQQANVFQQIQLTRYWKLIKVCLFCFRITIYVISRPTNFLIPIETFLKITRTIFENPTKKFLLSFWLWTSIKNVINWKTPTREEEFDLLSH